jgi:hypothetical protein
MNYAEHKNALFQPGKRITAIFDVPVKIRTFGRSFQEKLEHFRVHFLVIINPPGNKCHA